MDFLGLPIDQALLFFFLMIFVGIIETISGGGALIIVPILLSIDVDYVDAIYTTKIIGMSLFVILIIYFHKKKMINLKQTLPLFVFSFIGGMIGGYVLNATDPKQLEIIIPIVIVIVLIYFTINPQKKENTSPKPKFSIMQYALFCCIPIGVYDGFLGPASGSMFIATLMLFLAYDAKNASILTKVLNCGTMLGSVFALGGSGNSIVLSTGILQIIAMGLGTIIGTKLVVHKGSAIVRPLILLISSVMLINFVYNTFV